MLTSTASNVTADVTAALETVKTGMADYSVSNLAMIWAAGLAFAAGPAIAWFGYRFVKGKATKALFKGKI